MKLKNNLAKKNLYSDENTTTNIKAGNYSKLNDDGFIKVGEYVNGNDVVIGKCIPIKNQKHNL